MAWIIAAASLWSCAINEKVKDYGNIRNGGNIKNVENVRIGIKYYSVLEPQTWADLNDDGNFIFGQNFYTDLNPCGSAGFSWPHYVVAPGKYSYLKMTIYHSFYPPFGGSSQK